MRTRLCSRSRLAISLILANGVFWLVFIVYFWWKGYLYNPHVKLFEEPAPPYIIWGRAFPFDQYMSPFMKASRILQWPSFYAASPLNFLASSRGIVGDTQYWGTSVGGYYLILVCLLSFIQWYLIAIFIDYLTHRVGQRSGRLQAG
jgi:hypothetical protein